MTITVLSVVVLLLCSRALVSVETRRRNRSQLRRGHEQRPGAASPPLPSTGATPLRPPTVSVVVPAINEEGCIGWVLEQMPEWISEVVLVDGRSIDRTEVVARTVFPSLVVVHQPQPGKGAALRAGFAAATGDIIVMLDADGSTNPAEIERFVQALQDGAQFVKGSRQMPDGGSADLTLVRGLGNRALVKFTNLLHGCHFTDLCYGYCAFWRRDLPALALAADGFEVETELILSAVRAGLSICEVPSVELPRLAGTSNLHAFRDGRRVLATIFSQRAGRMSWRALPHPRVKLVPAQVASPGSPEWVPAGKDRRRNDRRVLSPEVAGYAGPERRRTDRRTEPGQTVIVYRAVEELVAPSAAPAREEIMLPTPAPALEQPASATATG